MMRRRIQSQPATLIMIHKVRRDRHSFPVYYDRWYTLGWTNSNLRVWQDPIHKYKGYGSVRDKDVRPAIHGIYKPGRLGFSVLIGWVRKFVARPSAVN